MEIRNGVIFKEEITNPKLKDGIDKLHVLMVFDNKFIPAIIRRHDFGFAIHFDDNQIEGYKKGNRSGIDGNFIMADDVRVKLYLLYVQDVDSKGPFSIAILGNSNYDWMIRGDYIDTNKPFKFAFIEPSPEKPEIDFVFARVMKPRLTYNKREMLNMLKKFNGITHYQMTEETIEKWFEENKYEEWI